MSARDAILELVGKWQRETTDPERARHLASILDDLRFLERVKFTPYIPTLYSSQPSAFENRFYKWLSNPGLSSSQQRDLFEFAHHIAFFSFDDFTAMFQSAFSGPISRWCMSQSGIRIDQSSWHSRLDEERYGRTWFCPITDSLLISVFHHVNNIEGKNRKPAFRDLMYFGDETKEVVAKGMENKIHKHIRAIGYQRLVLLEDFVGTGDQTYKTVEWAVKTLKLPVLFCAMIIAPEGADKYRLLKTRLDAERTKDTSLPEFAFAPIIELDPECFVYNTNTKPEALFDRIRILAEEIHARLESSMQQCENGALGYSKPDSPQKGATVVMFSNTPNNSLPLLHHGADRWTPLFPRVTRQLK